MYFTKPVDGNRPNVVTAVGGNWRVLVDNRELKEGESVLMGAKLHITNAKVVGYNWVTNRVLLPGQTTWITLEKFSSQLKSGEYLKTLPTKVEVNVRMKVQGNIAVKIDTNPSSPTSNWGETYSIDVTGLIDYGGICLN